MPDAPFDRDQLKALAAERIEEPRRDHPDDAVVHVPELVRSMRELEYAARLSYEDDEMSEDFALGIWTALAGLRHDFGIRDSRYVTTTRDPGGSR